MGLLETNVSDAKRAVSWGMFFNIILTPMILGMVGWPKSKSYLCPYNMENNLKS